MEFRTIVDVEDPGFRIEPCEEMLFVGSCFADNIGARFKEEKFRATVNPFGVMYNPASILHTVERLSLAEPSILGSLRTAFFTLGTNHIYRLKETGEIVDNCQKRPQSLFTEEELTVDECANYLQKAIDILRAANPDIRVVLTVSPIRYAYEIVNDELRDYRFYAEDMLHPSSQAVEYIWQRLSEVYLSDAAKLFLQEWQPLKAALNHKPFNPESQEYRIFMDKTMLKIAELQKKYPNFAV